MARGQDIPGTSGARTVALDPAELHASGVRLTMAAGDAGPDLAAATAGDCAGGFPGTSAAAYSALVTQWQEENRALSEQLDALASRLDGVAREYVAADESHAARLSGAAGSATAGQAAAVLNL